MGQSGLLFLLHLWHPWIRYFLMDPCLRCLWTRFLLWGPQLLSVLWGRSLHLLHIRQCFPYFPLVHLTRMIHLNRMILMIQLLHLLLWIPQDPFHHLHRLLQSGHWVLWLRLPPRRCPLEERLLLFLKKMGATCLLKLE